MPSSFNQIHSEELEPPDPEPSPILPSSVPLTFQASAITRCGVVFLTEGLLSKCQLTACHEAHFQCANYAVVYAGHLASILSLDHKVFGVSRHSKNYELYMQFVHEKVQA
jgi:hypothetical protein